jgi:hypothetical protein
MVSLLRWLLLISVPARDDLPRRAAFQLSQLSL